jgi:hypothetical protein
MLKDNYENIVKGNIQNADTQADMAKEENVPNFKRIFPNVACIFELAQNYSSEVQPIVTLILRETFNISTLEINTLLLFVRELLEWVARWIFRLIPLLGEETKSLSFTGYFVQEFCT